MQRDQILILVATEDGATLCANCDGASHLVQRFDAAARDANPRSNVIDFAGVRTSRRALARNVAGVLNACAATEAYDGIVIIAPAGMMWELRRAMDGASSNLAITEILETPQNHNVLAQIAPQFVLTREQDLKAVS